MTTTSTLLAALVLLAAGAPNVPPTASDATSLAATKKWDDLFATFLSAKPKDYSDADRATIAKALLQGAQGVKDSDSVACISMAEKSVAFAETVPALLLAGEMNQKVQQNGDATRELERVLALDAKNNEAHLQRAELALGEGEAQVALGHLQAIGKGYETSRVKGDVTRAQAALHAKADGEAALRRQEAAVQRDEAAGSAPPSGGPPSPPPTKGKRGQQGVIIDVGDGASPQAAPGAPVDPVSDGSIGGLRSKAADHFTFNYGTNDRDWGQRADYEGHVMDALEEAYEFVGNTLHANREQKVQVVLYTKEEYDLHFGGTELSRAAGFFSGKIRINGAEEMTPEVRVVIVHEYTHAVVDELVNHQKVPAWVQEGTATYVENQYRYAQGMPGADDGWRTRLRSMASSGALPKLADLDRGFLSFRNPRMAYAYAGKAIELLVEQHGVEGLVDTFRNTATEGWEKAFHEEYGEQAGLDDEVKEELLK